MKRTSLLLNIFTTFSTVTATVTSNHMIKTINNVAIVPMFDDNYGKSNLPPSIFPLYSSLFFFLSPFLPLFLGLKHEMKYNSIIGYILIDKATNSAALVDPAEPGPVKRACKDLNVDVKVSNCFNDHVNVLDSFTILHITCKCLCTADDTEHSQTRRSYWRQFGY